MTGKIPVSLIVDDGGVINMSHFHQLQVKHDLLIPVSFARKFAGICRKNGIKGKFSIVPVPAGLGRLDGVVQQVPKRQVEAMLDLLRAEIAPLFSITPEILTHFLAYNLQNGSCRHILEDTYFEKLGDLEIADYVSLALEILVNKGFAPSGVTSPWMCGAANERNYARGIGIAFRRVLKRNKCFYFLHCQDEIQIPTLICDTPETGQVTTIPANTEDAFWSGQRPRSPQMARKLVKTGIDAILTADGNHGVARDLFEKGLPITLLSHWQSLYADGRAVGLAALDELTMRINRTFGDRIEWLTFEELADRR